MKKSNKKEKIIYSLFFCRKSKVSNLDMDYFFNITGNLNLKEKEKFAERLLKLIESL